MTISLKNGYTLILLLFLVVSSCSTIRNTTEDYTINYSRSSSNDYRTSRSSTSDREIRNNSDKVKVEENTKKSKEINEGQVVVKKTKEKQKSKKPTIKTRKVKSNSVRMDIVKYSKKFDGTRYKYGGKNPFGFDCSGFTSYVFNKYDFNLPPSANLQSTYGDEIPLESVVEGDLLFFNIEGTIGHVAIVVLHEDDQLLMRHASSSSGVIKEDYYQSEYWQKRFSHAIDVIGDE